MPYSRLAGPFVAGALSVLGALAPAQAETLTDALIKAYQMSPVLEAERAALRNTDERVALARSARRPSLTALGSAEVAADENSDWELFDTYQAQLQSSLLLYDHGQTAAAIDAAKSAVAAGRAQLRNVEQVVLLNTVAAFMDVRRNIQSVQVARNNVSVLQEQVRATRDRFDLGEVTRTDVSLAEARLAQARANLAAFEGQLTTAREAYLAVVGAPARDLQAPPALPQVPQALERIEAIAMREHPALNAARYLETVAQYDLTRARAARGPSVSLEATATARNADGLTGRSDNLGVGVGVTGRVPLYAGGELSALVRQAEAVLQQRRFEVQDTARSIREEAAVALSNLRVARATIVANREEVRAAQVAFEGVQEEAILGARTTLDVLDLEQDLRDAQLALATSLRDEYVAAYQLLSAMGLLSVEFLNLGIPTYNPDVNYNRVQNAPYSTVEGGILEKLRDRYAR
ncbi:TolC family outer membrane protein [Rhodobacteraceae bacterium 2CG4]|uniref:TolC family outer membrane protein n=1 Tax=Halovulum marinum TaxID=2662447 RepID=A0A6L5YZL4_9RHOB|nr:TolC family outer membrane protein [Halovulum marinum]MSU89756.1 TolC family outer membrane protein [Halovulum marinum]